MSAEPLKGHQYISLETYRKSGEGVRTPVWFAQDGKDGSTVYVRTGRQSGKVKRIRHTTCVKLAPSDMRGKIKGGWVDGDAAIFPFGTPEYEVGERIMNQKYGLVKRILERIIEGKQFDRVMLKITLR